jgi:hypothetical protein
MVPQALRARAAGRRVFVEFDGVMANSDIWVNGFHLGQRPYGYVGFAYELTPRLVSGADASVLAVRVAETFMGIVYGSDSRCRTLLSQVGSLRQWPARGAYLSPRACGT